MLKRYLQGAYLICSLIGLVLLQVTVVNGQRSMVIERETKAETMLGSGQTIRMARATWDTGWFQAEIFKILFESLGYTVDGPHTRDSADFYKAVIEGKMDLWVNGWFPGHNSYIESARDKVEMQEPHIGQADCLTCPKSQPQPRLISRKPIYRKNKPFPLETHRARGLPRTLSKMVWKGRGGVAFRG